MARTALTLALAAGLSAWAAAQSSAGPNAADRLRLLAANRVLLQALLADGLAASDAGDDGLKRIDACREAARTLSRALETACTGDRPDADRVAELSDHLGEVLADGLLPALDRARPDYRPGSPDFDKFHDLDRRSADDARKAAGLIPAGGKFAEQPQVRTARGKLAAAAGRFPEGK